MQRHVLVFDFDNVMAMTHPFIEQAFDAFFAREFQLSPAEATRQRQETYAAHGCAVAGMAERYHQGPVWVADAFARLGHTSSALFLATQPPCPYMPNLLDMASQQGYQLAILSQNHINAIQPILSAHDLSLHIPAAYIFDRSRLGPSWNKRTKDPYRFLMHTLGLTSTDRLTMFEDTPTNLPSARALGWHTVLVGHRLPTPAQDTAIDEYHPDIQTALRHRLAQASEV